MSVHAAFVPAIPRRQKRRRYANARLSLDQVRAAWELYRAGYSTAWIAERIWRQHGFKNARSCRAALYRAFRLDCGGSRTKSHGVALHRFGDRPCEGCGCDRDERTFSCRACISRHSKRRGVGTNAAPPVARTCIGCGCSLDERTRGCRPCTDRHSKRRCKPERSATTAKTRAPLQTQGG